MRKCWLRNEQSQLSITSVCMETSPGPPLVIMGAALSRLSRVRGPSLLTPLSHPQAQVYLLPLLPGAPLLHRAAVCSGRRQRWGFFQKGWGWHLVQDAFQSPAPGGRGGGRCWRPRRLWHLCPFPHSHH